MDIKRKRRKYMEKYRVTTVGALLTALCSDPQRTQQTDTWCMYAAGTGDYAPDTPCYPADYPEFGDSGFVHLPPDAVRQGMSAYLTDTLLCEVAEEVLSHRNQADAELLVRTLNYYLENDCFPQQDGKTLHQLDAILQGYQWERGFQVLRGILAEPACDLSIALEIFYRAGGYDYLEENRRVLSPDALVFLGALHTDIASGRYQRSVRHYNIPLTKIQRYKLERRQVPAVFLTDL